MKLNDWTGQSYSTREQPHFIDELHWTYSDNEQ